MRTMKRKAGIYMPRAPDPRAEQAHELYKSGMKLVEIASQLNIPSGTVRRWKSTYNWDNERSDKKVNVRKDNSERSQRKKEVVAKEVKQVMDNPDLTDKQRLFCLQYIKCFNATKAYQKVYEVSYNVAAAAGPRLLGNVRLQAEIAKLKQAKYNKAMLEPEDIFQKWMDIAFADITDFVSFGNEKIKVYTDAGEEKELTVSYVNIKNSTEVDGTLVDEVSKGKDGVRVKLSGRTKALDWLTAHMDMATEEQRARVEHLRAQTDKITGGDQDDTEDKVAELFKKIEGELHGAD